MDKYEDFRSKFEAVSDPEKAISMSAYMRSQFHFYGIPSPERKAVYAEFLKAEKKSKNIDWNFCDQCFRDDHREFQYLACDYLSSMKKFATYEDIPKIRNYILTRSWWDTVDTLCKVIGNIGLRDERVKKLMLEWSQDENFWIRRTALEHQLGLRDKTDKELLAQIIVNNFGSDEFFINKAIGWALRDYSKTNPEWVRSFLNSYADRMCPLSIREAEKYLPL
ncbi:MAG: DNA alkylation repair protein [Bilifractor sp.]